MKFYGDPIGPPTKEGGSRARLCATYEVEDGRLLTLSVDGHVIAVYRHDGTYWAVDGTCPHKGLPLEEAAVDQGVIVCPNHFWRFDAVSGEAVWPKNGRHLRHYAVTVEADELFVELAATGDPNYAVQVPRGTLP